MSDISKNFFVVLLALLVFSMITPVAAGTTWVVDDSGGSHFTTIQDAVDTASAGDTIIVRDGTYNENVNVNKRLTIGSENGYDSTTVVALNTNDHVFDVTADYVNISGFTVEGATGSRGVRLYSANYCNVSDIKASNNYNGIWLDYSNNNTLTGNTVSNNDCGILLESSSNNTLTGNTALNNNYGIRLYDSSNNTLTGNTAKGNNFGIILGYSSNNNTLTGNTAKGNNYDGINLDDSSNNNTLTGNIVSSNNYDGIRLRYASNNTLTGNTVSNNDDFGIRLHDSSNNLIYNNYFENTNNAYDNGANTWNITKAPETNIIGGPYLGGNYWSDYAGFDTDEDGLGDTMVPYDSSGDIINGGDYHPLTGVPGTTWYVDDDGGSDFTTIQDAVDAASAGYTIIVRDGTYTENVDVNKRLTIGSENGYDSTTVTASNTNDQVFDVTADYVNISGFTVEGATGSIGVRLYSANYCNVSDINASDNYYGISLSYSNNNTLTGNTVSNNNVGIWLESSINNILTGNTVSNNYIYGIYLYDSSNNLIYNNYFKNNPINAYDDGTNTWNITKTPETNIIGGPYMGGNYWSGYTGVDTDEDGLGDTSYSITGGSNQDMLPLVKDFFISCDSSGDEKNMFMPGEEIYVKAEGLSPSTSYKVWIQDNPVSDGDTLIASEDPS